MEALARGLLALCLAVLPVVAGAQTITVFAAASLKEALDAVVKPFESATGHKATISYAASNALARQIESGAPATLFISADTEWIDDVESRGLAIAGTRVNLLLNDLVLVAPASSAATLRIAPGFDLDRKSTRLNSSHIQKSRMPSSA